MSVTEIESAISQLPVSDLAEWMGRLARYHEQVWEHQIEDDLEAGRLESLLAEVDKEYEAGLARPR